MAAARQGLPVRLDRAPQRGAAFALTRASRRARTRSIGSRSRASRSRARGSSLIFNHPPAVARPPSPGPAHYLVARDHRLPALRHVHLLMNVLHRDLLVSARSIHSEPIGRVAGAAQRKFYMRVTAWRRRRLSRRRCVTKEESMGQILASVALGVSLLVAVSSEVSAWVCFATGVGSGRWGPQLRHH